MVKEIDFKAFRATVSVISLEDPRWNLQAKKQGNTPPDTFSLRGDIVDEVTEKLFKLQEMLGSPPRDLIFKVEEDWTFAS